MPDLSLCLALVSLFWCLFLFDGWHKLFRDSDAGWHIRTGETILDTRNLTRTDPYSFTRGGTPWMDWEWGADVLSGAAHRIAGLRGVAILFAVAIAACSWLWVRLSFAAGGDFLLSCALALPMLSTVNMHWLARPHVFGWVLLLLWLLFLERATWKPRLVLGCAFVFGAVWANVHGSFFLAPIVALCYRRMWIGAVFALGTILNPYGLDLHAHVFRYLTDRDLLARVAEFQSFNFHADGAQWILLTVLVAMAGGVLAVQHRRIDHALVILLLTAISLRSARGLPILALCALPLANVHLSKALARVAHLVPAVRYSGRLRLLDGGCSGWMWAPLAVLLVCLFPAPAAGFPADQFPVAASAAVASLPASARVLSPDKFGGYLIYRFNGARKVYFDGRSDFYGSQFMKDYLRLMEARPGWREIAARYSFTHALLPVDSPLLDALASSGWKTNYKDATAALLARPD